MKLIIFEDEAAPNLNPLALTRPVYELLCGLDTLKEKIIRQWPAAEIYLHCRQELQATVQENNPELAVNRVPEGDCVLINGRLLVQARMNQLHLDENLVYSQDGALVCARLTSDQVPKRQIEAGQLLKLLDLAQLRSAPLTDQKLIAYPWHLVEHNPDQIALDFAASGLAGRSEGQVYPGASLLNPDQIYIGKNARIYPGVVLDAENGPIFVTDQVKIMPNAVIEGPCFIGPDTIIKIGAKIYAGCSFGPVCKVGGEVENSIIHGRSNKQHEGFLGHSYVGEWCNFGADTNNSDLKNNYTRVKVQINRELVDTGLLFVGLFMGDHSKTGINTMFNTGTVIGVACNVYGADFPPRFIPSFSWGGSHIIVKYDLEKSIQTARVAMARRQHTLTLAMAQLLEFIYVS